MKIITDIAQLRKTAEEVKEGEDIWEIVANLFDELKEDHVLELKEYQPWGLAANQLGYNKRIFVMVMTPYPPICVVNPVITKERGSQLGREACFSLPGVIVMVKRPYQVVVKGENQYRKPVKHKLRGYLARVACHEVDHLAGKLIIDYKQ